MKRILQVSVLLVIVFVGQSIKAAHYWVTNNTDKTQKIEFRQYSSPVKAAVGSTILTLDSGKTLDAWNAHYVTEILFNDKSYNSASFNLPQGSIVDVYNKDKCRATQKYGACEQENVYAMLEPGQWFGFKIVTHPITKEPVLMPENGNEESYFETALLQDLAKKIQESFKK